MHHNEGANSDLEWIRMMSCPRPASVLLAQCGLPPELYSGHSFRRGGATFLFNLGADPITIKFCGDWLSDSYLNYVSVDLSSRLAAQTMIVSAINPWFFPLLFGARVVFVSWNSNKFSFVREPQNVFFLYTAGSGVILANQRIDMRGITPKMPLLKKIFNSYHP